DYLNGPHVEIRGPSKKNFTVKFINEETNVLVFQDSIPSNHYSKAHAEHYVKWKTEIYSDGKIIKKDILDLKGQPVQITFESSALGDNVCWIPYVEEFRKMHQCIVYCATFHNHLFTTEYPKIHFVNRRQKKSGVIANYKIGWFGKGEKSNRNPVDCRTIPLQELPCSILKVPYKEIRPKVKHDTRKPILREEKYVVISTCSTAQAKYWNRSGAWQELINWLAKTGYKVVNIGREKNKFSNVIDRSGMKTITDITNIIQNAEFFIGISSGLTWLAWALGKKAVMISGFTAPWFEFQENNYRVHNKDVCHSCFSNPKYGFNRGDWMWCPVHKNTSKQFICTKSITVEIVQQKILELQKDLKNG
ncbi:MAG: autotransporter strand-loop-strand O-heptosyltransferase, partial [Candidatus Heimdallarchaeota archaeon]